MAIVIAGDIATRLAGDVIVVVIVIVIIIVIVIVIVFAIVIVIVIVIVNSIAGDIAASRLRCQSHPWHPYGSSPMSSAWLLSL